MKKLIGFSIVFILMVVISCDQSTDDGSSSEEKPYFCLTNSCDFGTSLNVLKTSVENRGGGTVKWTFRQPYYKDQNNNEIPVNWVTVSPMSGSVAAHSEVEITVSIDRSSIQSGSYTLRLKPNTDTLVSEPVSPGCLVSYLYVTQP